MHHKPCGYYKFGNKIQAEINDYNRLKKIDIRIPEMIDMDVENERVLKEYIEGNTIFEPIKSDCMKNEYVEQVKAMCDLLYLANTNIDYFPTNFVVQNELIYYIDFEIRLSQSHWL